MRKNNFIPLINVQCYKNYFTSSSHSHTSHIYGTADQFGERLMFSLITAHHISREFNSEHLPPFHIQKIYTSDFFFRVLNLNIIGLKQPSVNTFLQNFALCCYVITI